MFPFQYSSLSQYSSFSQYFTLSSFFQQSKFSFLSVFSFFFSFNIPRFQYSIFFSFSQYFSFSFNILSFHSFQYSSVPEFFNIPLSNFFLIFQFFQFLSTFQHFTPSSSIPVQPKFPAKKNNSSSTSFSQFWKFLVHHIPNSPHSSFPVFQ